MLARERRQLIVNQLHRVGRVRTAELVTQFAVSDVTVRADLGALEREGRLTRTHGGAIPSDPSQIVVGFDLRMAMQAEAKRRIALRAVEFIHSNQTIILDAGTTTNHLAQALPDVSNLSIYTPGLPQAQQLLGVSGVDVHLLGGAVDEAWLQTVGTPREQGIKGLLVETAFLGTWGIDSDLDVVDQSTALGRAKKQYMRRARTVVLLADATKFERAGSVKIMAVDDVDVLITDNSLPTATQEMLAALNVELIVV